MLFTDNFLKDEPIVVYYAMLYFVIDALKCAMLPRTQSLAFLPCPWCLTFYCSAKETLNCGNRDDKMADLLDFFRFCRATLLGIHSC